MNQVAPTDQTDQPTNDSDTPLLRGVVRLWSIFGGTGLGIGGLDTGFAVKCQGDRAGTITIWLVIREINDLHMATKVEGETYREILSSENLSSRLEEVVVPSQPQEEDDKQSIVLEWRGMPADLGFRSSEGPSGGLECRCWGLPRSIRDGVNAVATKPAHHPTHKPPPQHTPQTRPN